MVLTISEISSDPPCKDDNARFTTIPLNLYLINNVEDIVVFLGIKVYNSDHFYQNCFFSKNCSSQFCTKTTIENSWFSKL